MRSAIEDLILLLAILAWLAGAVIAQGGWMTLGAILFPLFAWYLVMEKVLTAWGWI